MAVTFDPQSTIGEFSCGLFRGHAHRREGRPECWDKATGTVEPAFSDYWSVIIEGNERGWVEVRFPLKRGRTLKRAVEEACAMFNHPSEIVPINGQFGRTIDLR